jgi:hypothetical protein
MNLASHNAIVDACGKNEEAPGLERRKKVRGSGTHAPPRPQKARQISNVWLWAPGRAPSHKRTTRPATAGHWLQHRDPRAPCPCAMFSAMFSAQPHTHTSPAAFRHSRTAPGRSGAPMQVAASDRWQPACFAPACRICLRPAHKRRAKPNCGPYAHSRHSHFVPVRVLHASPHAPPLPRLPSARQRGRYAHDGCPRPSLLFERARKAPG